MMSSFFWRATEYTSPARNLSKMVSVKINGETGFFFASISYSTYPVKMAQH